MSWYRICAILRDDEHLIVKQGKQPMAMDLRRVVVVGTTGSGKTTAAAELARRLDVSHVEMDALYWGPDWTATPAAEFEARVKEAVAGDSWVLYGNYGVVRHIVGPRSTTLVWLAHRYGPWWPGFFGGALVVPSPERSCGTVTERAFGIRF